MRVTQVKEIGLYFPDCPAVAADLETQFNIYVQLSLTNVLPSPWPSSWSPQSNVSNPGVTVMEGYSAQYYYSTAPPCVRPPGWTPDEDAIVGALMQGRLSFTVFLIRSVEVQGS